MLLYTSLISILTRISVIDRLTIFIAKIEPVCANEISLEFSGSASIANATVGIFSVAENGRICGASSGNNGMENTSPPFNIQYICL